MSKKVSEVLESALVRAREMVDANTVIGEPLTIGATTIVPVSIVKVGLASGGADMAAKTAGVSGSFGGGLGCGMSVTPVALVIMQGETVRVQPIDQPARSATERIVEQIPQLVDKLTELLAHRKEHNEN